MSKKDETYQPNMISRALEPAVKAVRSSISGAPGWLIGLIALIGPIWLWLLVETLQEVWTLVSGTPQSGNGKTVADANRNRIQAIFFGVGIIGALLATIIVPVRLWLQNRQTITAEQGHITDRLNKAIEMLGAEKTVKFRVRTYEYDLPAGDHSDRVERNQRAGTDPVVPPDAENLTFGEWQTAEETVPNLEVRLGAIYSLRRIAEDSERDHITVMETLCAYIRENAPARDAQDHGLGDWPEWIEDATEEQQAERDRAIRQRAGGFDPEGRYTPGAFREWINGLQAPRADIQAAITVLGRRAPERIAHERRQKRDPDATYGYRLDLRGANLRKADMSDLDLSHAQMDGARLEGADLSGARMEGANFSGARMEGAILIGARMERANLRRARMEGANLFEARMEGAILSEARMERADLIVARMERADLIGARMEEANLGGARMEGANLLGANLKSADLNRCTFACTRLRSADFTEAKHLSQQQVNIAHGDVETVLPDGVVMPDHWDDETDTRPWNDTHYDDWIARGALPGTPRQEQA